MGHGSPAATRRGATTFYASGNVLTAEAGRATYDEYDLGTTVGAWFTLEMFQWYVYDKAVACYALGRPLPSIDEIGWEGVFTTPCANFPVGGPALSMDCSRLLPQGRLPRVWTPLPLSDTRKSESTKCDR